MQCGLGAMFIAMQCGLGPMRLRCNVVWAQCGCDAMWFGPNAVVKQCCLGALWLRRNAVGAQSTCLGRNKKKYDSTDSGLLHAKKQTKTNPYPCLGARAFSDYHVYILF